MLLRSICWIKVTLDTFTRVSSSFIAAVVDEFSWSLVL